MDGSGVVSSITITVIIGSKTAPNAVGDIVLSVGTNGVWSYSLSEPHYVFAVRKFN